MTTLTAKQQFWSEQLDEAQRSGQPLCEYARAHNIPAQKLYQWRNALKKITTTRTTHAAPKKTTISHRRGCL